MNIVESTPIIQRCMNASQNIKDYFEEERYLTELEQEEQRTPQVLSVIAVNLVLDELSEIGLETNFTAEDLIESNLDLNTMFDIRAIFDKDNLYSILKNLPEELYSEFKAVIENIEIAEDFLYNVVDFFVHATPNNEQWNAMSLVSDHWYSTLQFSNHITAIIDKIELHSDKNKACVDDYNIDSIKMFLQNYADNQHRVQLIVDYCLKNFPNLNTNILNKYVHDYDREKLDPVVLPMFADYFANKKEYDKEPECVALHHKTVWHHEEYWVANTDKVVSREQLVIIVAANAIDGYRTTELNNRCKFASKLCSSENKSFFTELVNLDFDKILGVEL